MYSLRLIIKGVMDEISDPGVRCFQSSINKFGFLKNLKSIALLSIVKG